MVLAGRSFAGAAMAVGGVCAAETVASATLVGVATVVPSMGVATAVCSSALLASAARSRSLISSISCCSCCSSPGLGGATVAGDGATEAGVEDWLEEGGMGGAEGSLRSRLAREGAGGAGGPPFSQRPPPSLSGVAPSTLGSPAPRRASRRRVFRVSRLKWTRLKSRPSFTAATVAAAAASFSRWLFNKVDEVGGAF